MTKKNKDQDLDQDQDLDKNKDQKTFIPNLSSRPLPPMVSRNRVSSMPRRGQSVYLELYMLDNLRNRMINEQKSLVRRLSDLENKLSVIEERMRDKKNAINQQPDAEKILANLPNTITMEF